MSPPTKEDIDHMSLADFLKTGLFVRNGQKALPVEVNAKIEHRYFEKC